MAISNERLYENAIDQEYCGWVCPYSFTARRFEHLGEFQRASEHADNCRRLARGDYSDPALRNLYLSAVELQLDGFPQLAAVKFKKLSETDFLNSARHLRECEAAIAGLEAQGGAPEAAGLEKGTAAPVYPDSEDETAQYLDAYNSQQRAPAEPRFNGWVRTAFFAVAAACFAFGGLIGVILGRLVL